MRHVLVLPVLVLRSFSPIFLRIVQKEDNFQKLGKQIKHQFSKSTSMT
jgi:hypothetical protein